MVVRSSAPVGLITRWFGTNWCGYDSTKRGVETDRKISEDADSSFLSIWKRGLRYSSRRRSNDLYLLGHCTAAGRLRRLGHVSADRQHQQHRKDPERWLTNAVSSFHPSLNLSPHHLHLYLHLYEIRYETMFLRHVNNASILQLKAALWCAARWCVGHLKSTSQNRARLVYLSRSAPRVPILGPYWALCQPLLSCCARQILRLYPE